MVKLKHPSFINQTGRDHTRGPPNRKTIHGKNRAHCHEIHLSRQPVVFDTAELFNTEVEFIIQQEAFNTFEEAALQVSSRRPIHKVGASCAQLQCLFICTLET